MKRLAIAIFLWILAAPSISGASAQDELLEAIQARLAATARRDIEAWSHFVDDNMLAPLEGEQLSKRAWINAHTSWPREVEYWYGPIEDLKVRVHGETALATYHARQFTRIGGQTTSVHKWQIETHIRRGTRWILVGVADGLIPPEPVAVPVDASTLDSYVGDYEWAPTLVSKIRRRGNVLVEEFTGQEPSELAAENATVFFIKGEAATGNASRIIFVRGAEGSVTHYIYRELGATDRIVSKTR